jgi:hypothetical protein
MIDTYHCPKCSRQLNASGVATLNDVEFPVFQCDSCIVEVEAFGDKFEVNFTFAVDASGAWFDPTRSD